MRPVKTCIWVYEDETTCGSMAEGNTDYCASHNGFIRKQAKQAQKVKIVTPPQKVSAKMAKDLQDYGVLRRKHLAEHPICQACKKVASEECHHKRGRGKYLLEPEYFLAVCADCHRRITEDSAWAFQMGYSFLRTETI